MSSLSLLKLINASFKEVDGLCHGLRKKLTDCGYSDHLFTVELLVREALNNAVCHGCCEDNKKEIFFKIVIDKNVMTIVVKDPGEGFDWQVQRPTPNLDTAKGRGRLIFETYADSYCYNEKGNSITIVKKL